MLWSGALLFIYISPCNAVEDGFLRLAYSWRKKNSSVQNTHAQTLWGTVTAAARPRHNAINSPSQNNKGLTVAALLIWTELSLTTHCSLAPYLTNFSIWHPKKHIYLNPSKPMEICGRGLRLWSHVTGSMAVGCIAGEQTLKWPLSGSHTFKGYF